MFIINVLMVSMCARLGVIVRIVDARIIAGVLLAGVGIVTVIAAGIVVVCADGVRCVSGIIISGVLTVLCLSLLGCVCVGAVG